MTDNQKEMKCTFALNDRNCQKMCWKLVYQTKRERERESKNDALKMVSVLNI